MFAKNASFGAAELVLPFRVLFFAVCVCVFCAHVILKYQENKM